MIRESAGRCPARPQLLVSVRAFLCSFLGLRPSTRSSTSSTASCSSGDRDGDADAISTRRRTSRSAGVYESSSSGGGGGRRGSRKNEDAGNDYAGGRGSTSSSGSNTKSDSVTRSNRTHRMDKSEGEGEPAPALPDGERGNLLQTRSQTCKSIMGVYLVSKSGWWDTGTLPLALENQERCLCFWQIPTGSDGSPKEISSMQDEQRRKAEPG